jgi:hypothetical protein
MLTFPSPFRLGTTPCGDSVFISPKDYDGGGVRGKSLSGHGVGVSALGLDTDFNPLS